MEKRGVVLDGKGLHVFLDWSVAMDYASLAVLIAALPAQKYALDLAIRHAEIMMLIHV